MMEMNEPNQPLTKEIIKNFENRLEVTLPEDYKKFLQKYDGGTPKQDTFKFKDDNDGSVLDDFFGINHPLDVMSMQYILKVFSNRVPINLLPIANDQYGNLLCLCIKGKDYGKIYFWDHENEAPDGQEPWWDNISLVADNFTEFIDGLYEYDLDDDDNEIRRYQDGTVTINDKIVN